MTALSRRDVLEALKRVKGERVRDIGIRQTAREVLADPEVRRLMREARDARTAWPWRVGTNLLMERTAVEMILERRAPNKEV